MRPENYLQAGLFNCGACGVLPSNSVVAFSRLARHFEDRLKASSTVAVASYGVVVQCSLTSEEAAVPVAEADAGCFEETDDRWFLSPTAHVAQSPSVSR